MTSGRRNLSRGFTRIHADNADNADPEIRTNKPTEMKAFFRSAFIRGRISDEAVMRREGQQCAR